LFFQSPADEILDATEEARNTLHPQRVVDVGASPLILQDAGFLQYIQVFGNSGNVRSNHRLEFTHAQFTVKKAFNHFEPAGMSESLKNFCAHLKVIGVACHKFSFLAK
jgi:hypothetical protein